MTDLLNTETADTSAQDGATLLDGEPTSADPNQEGGTEDAKAGDENTDNTEAKADESSEGEPDGPPESYDLKAPEGETFDEGFLSTFEEASRELGLSNEKAQALIDKVSPVLQERQLANLEAMQKGWVEESRADKEFGGDKFEENLAVAKQAYDKFMSPAGKELFVASGLGNHPEIIRMFHKIGGLLKEDSFVGGQKDGSGPSGPRDFNQIAESIYGKKE